MSSETDEILANLKSDLKSGVQGYSKGDLSVQMVDPGKRFDLYKLLLAEEQRAFRSPTTLGEVVEP